MSAANVNSDLWMDVVVYDIWAIDWGEASVPNIQANYKQTLLLFKDAGGTTIPLVIDDDDDELKLTAAGALC
jgi:hypothetical protein